MGWRKASGGLHQMPIQRPNFDFSGEPSFQMRIQRDDVVFAQLADCLLQP